MSEREQPYPGEGWRLLRDGELLEDGDEVLCDDGGWVNTGLVGSYAADNAYRRRIPIETPQPDLVNAPPHYRQGGIECIDAIRAALTDDEFRGFCKGNVIKYAWRERHKGGDADLSKAGDYLDYIKQAKEETQ